jgi:polar amino acid transport system permease protein
MHYDWDFSIFAPYIPALRNGLIVTLKLSIISSLLGTILGIPISFLLRNKILKYFAFPLNDIFRAIPVLVLMYLLFYFPYTDIFGIEPLSSYACALLALIIAQAVFTADIVRGAINNISLDSVKGAESQGLLKKQVYWLVIIPDVVKQILPTLVAFYIGNIKLSCLASAINADELLFTAKLISSQKSRSLEAWILITIIYIILVVPFSLLTRKLESSKWIKKSQ